VLVVLVRRLVGRHLMASERDCLGQKQKRFDCKQKRDLWLLLVARRNLAPSFIATNLPIIFEHWNWNLDWKG